MNWSDIAWLDKESALKASADLAEADYQVAETDMERDIYFTRWQQAVHRIVEHKKTMPARLRAAREAAFLKAARSRARDHLELIR